MLELLLEHEQCVPSRAHAHQYCDPGMSSIVWYSIQLSLGLEP